MIRAERRRRHPEKSGVVGGDVEALDAGKGADTYVVIKKKTKKEDESEAQE